MPVSSGGRVLPGRTNGALAVSVDRYFDLSLLGLVSSGYFAVLGSGYLDWPAALIAAAGLLLRALMAFGIVRWTFPKGASFVLPAACVAFYAIDYTLLSREFLPSAIHLVVFLAVLQLLTAQTTRDYVFVGIIAFLELIAATLLSPDLGFFVFLALFLIFGVATFASAEIRRSVRKPRNLGRGGLRRFHWRLAGLTVLVSLGILVLTGGMFFLLPRTARAAFQHLIPDRYHIPGFSNEMRLGEIGEIQQRRIAVMHVRPVGSESTANLKWRGNALSQFDGRRWYNPPEAGNVLRVRSGSVLLADNPQRWRKGKRLAYEVRLHSIGNDALFFAGTPEFLTINVPSVVRNSHGGVRAGYGNTDNLQYVAHAFVEETAEPSALWVPQVTEAERVNNLLLPPLDPRIIELARKLTESDTSPEGKARSLEKYFHTQFGYTTDLLSEPVRDPLAHFLFERRKGHCEYFSSAMAVMLRAVNVPARIANGFQSGEYNPLTGWTVVRASDAHSWVEAWMPGRGWTTFDPTPPSARTPGLSIVGRFGLYLDAAETFWHEWVLNYDRDRQLVLASRVESGGRDFGSRWAAGFGERFEALKTATVALAKRWGITAMLAILVLATGRRFGPRVLRWWRTLRRVREVRRGAALASDATLLYQRMLGVLRRRGYQKSAWTTPSEFADHLPPSDASVLVAEFTAAYHDLRFGGNPAAAPRMIELLAELERR
ncbi:MAG TPA: DUF3488 and transglutaminase-like domain-containing protein [Bryobacteraceae bacterium]|nr:DUF3488 and transglutaminase-like domain-containing protein [Bryobacteraceae bacterium]